MLVGIQIEFKEGLKTPLFSSPYAIENEKPLDDSLRMNYGRNQNLDMPITQVSVFIKEVS